MRYSRIYIVVFTTRNPRPKNENHKNTSHYTATHEGAVAKIEM